jgi:Bacteriophage probable baseplate hub protein
MARYRSYAPDFRIQINEQELPAGLRSSVTSIRYQDGTEGADRVEIGFANANLRWLQSHVRGLGFRPPTGVKIGPVRALQAAPGMLDLDNKLSLAMGYAPDPLEDMFLGEVTGLRVGFPNGAVPQLTLVAHDYLHRLAEGTIARGFGLLPDFVIASILSAENLLVPVIDPTIVGASTAVTALNLIFKGTGRKQGSTGSGQSDLDLLKEIANSYDADFWVDHDVLYLSRFLKEYSPRLTLTWGESLIEFTPEVTTVGQVAGVSMKFTLREIPLDFLVTAFWDFDRESLGIRVQPGVAAAKAKAGVTTTFTIIDRPISSPADIAKSALVIVHELRSKLNKRVTGSGSAVGDPRIRAGAIVRLEGLGPDFSGDYRVSGATHSVDANGYRTTFQVYKEILP